MPKNYELIEHTADVGIRVKGDDLEGLFANAALAMFDVMAEAGNEEAEKKEINIRLKADNLEELFIYWLNELLSQSATKELIFSAFKIARLDKNNLEAKAIGCDVKNYRVNSEVKAATYHQLKLQQLKSGWQAEVILDV
ncbi:MAG: hypothetical protein A3K83_06005 [Omnitrophica WOR_2 bacterium RBG_13_44_8b]|nr:MAG: hypothetical protein A3K83_06005 [Omnitrophica WOR_2 bacterium RBG_13_44_8b]